MATISIGTSQNDWTRESGTTATSAFSDPGAYAYNNPIPSTNTGVGRYVIALPDVGSMGNPLSDCTFMAFFYFITVVNPIFVKARFWGLSPFDSTKALGTYLGECTGTQGGTAGPAGANSLFCQAITIVSDKTLTPPGMRLPGSPNAIPSAFGVATVMFDAVGCSHIVVELRRENGGSMDQVGFCWRTF
jgi:hypothetical protein